MYPPGHLGVAMLVFAPLAYYLCWTGRERRVWLGTATMVLLATLPDADVYVPGVAHRGPTHTVWAALLVGAVLALLGWRLAARRRASASRFAFLLGAGSVLVHLLADIVTPMGVRPFAPLLETEYTLALVASRDPGANTLLLVAGAVALSPSLGHAWVRAGYPLPAWPTRTLARVPVGAERADPADD